MIYEKQKCLNNIRFLAKAKGINLGDLETGAGVSAGYLSRISKEDSRSSPSIEVLSSFSEKLGVSIDGLVGYDYAGMSPTERYIIDFIERLVDGTYNGTLTWEKESLAVFAKLSVYRDETTDHPLFVGDDDRAVYNSYFATQPGTKPVAEFYHTALTGGNVLYISKVSYPNTNGHDIELYITQKMEYQHDSHVEPVCATNPTVETTFDTALNRLYDVIHDSCRNVKVNQAVRSAIDSFMNPDDDDGLPF